MKNPFEAIRELFEDLIEKIKPLYCIMVLRLKTEHGFKKTVEELIKEAYKEFTILNDNLSMFMAYRMICNMYGYTTMMYVINEYHQRGYFKEEINSRKDTFKNDQI